jgi:clan AA aspartic protease (TIGR02281 family)
MLALGVVAGDSQALAAQPDPAALLQQHRLGAAQGSPAALDSLGTMFERGSAVPADFAKAYALYHLAASRQSADPALVSRATQHRDALGARMSAAQLQRVNELIALCNGSDVNRCGEIIIAAGGLAVASASARTTRDGKMVVPLEPEGGVFVVPAVINDVMTLKFTVDTGAADVSIPADVVASLVASGFIAQSDFLGEANYQLADGSLRLKKQFRIRSLKVGDLVVENLRGSVSAEKAPPLLGQTFLRRLKSWSMDTTAHVLTIE